MVILEIQSYPPNTAALGAGEQTSVKGVILHYQEEAYSGLENQQRSTEVQYGGGGGLTVSKQDLPHVWFMLHL